MMVAMQLHVMCRKLMIRMHRVIDPDAVTHADGRGESAFFLHPNTSIYTTLTIWPYRIFAMLLPTTLRHLVLRSPPRTTVQSDKQADSPS